MSGESGAGKTENSKRLMEFLTSQSSGSGGSGNGEQSLEDKILECNPILEAMGNAKTLMNNNSSRFGKFTKILFDNGKVAGAKIETYLLEKSRIVLQEPNERNYHMFYLMFCAKNPEFQLNNVKDFKYMWGNGRGNQALEIVNRDDMEYFKEMDDCYAKVGFSENEKNESYRAVAAVLHIGNLHTTIYISLFLFFFFFGIWFF